MLRIRYFLNLAVCFSMFSLTTVLFSQQPDDWSPTPNPSSGVFLGQATIDAVPAVEGDWSAAFTQDGICAGAAILMINDGIAYINMQIYGDDNTTPGVDEGMNVGESFTLKVWDSSADAILEYPESFDCWYNNNGAPMGGCGGYTEVYNFSVPPVDPDFVVSLNVQGGSDPTGYSLTIGFSPDATDGYDDGIDSYAPPAPPPPAFDAALSWDGDRYYTQILNGSSDDLVEHVYDIQLAYPTDNLITLTWDNTGWSDLGTFSLTDAFDGALGIDIDMTQEDTLTLDNPAFNALKLKVTPQGVAYFSPSAFFTYSTAFLTVTFTDASIPGSSDEIVSWSWDFGDGGDGSTEQNPTNTYDEAGIYEVTLTVTDDNELSDSYTASVTVALPVGPTAEFGYVANQLTVSFADGSEAGDGAITDWSWDFGDNSTSTEQNPIHNYTGYAVYTVSLTVTDENDLQDTIEGDVDVLGGLVIPPFTFYPNPLSGVFFGQVTLDGVSVTEDDVIAAFDPEGNCAGAGVFIVNEGDAYIYNFSIYGDDETTPDYDEGMEAGDEYFTLKLYDESTGNTIDYSESFSGWSNQNGAPMPGYDDPYVVYNFSTTDLQPPVADFSGDPRSGDAPHEVQFADESTEGSGAITGWEWNFGVEGTFSDYSELEDPSYTYDLTIDPSGVYTVTLTVTDANGLTNTMTKENYIIVGTAGVNDAPVATDINMSLMEDNTGTQPPYGDYSFDADGDELTFSASGPSHGTIGGDGVTYVPNPNYYGFDSFTYTATDPDGLSDEGTVSVIIMPDGMDPPIAVISGPESVVETTEGVTLTGWNSWDPDDCPTGEGCPDVQGFEWSTVNPPGFTLQIPGPGEATFDAPEVEADLPFIFSLRVTDGQFWSELDFITVTVQNNNGPVLDPIGAQYTTEASLDINLSATDEGGDDLTFSATSSDPDNVTVSVGDPSVDNDTTTAVLTLSFTEEWSGSAFVTAFVCDGVPSHCDSETFLVSVEQGQLGVDDIVVLPEVFVLRQNYPNPFNPVTTIAYDIPKITKVRIDMYNILGQKVRTLVNGTHQPGVYHIRWNGTNDFGNPVSSGMYFYRISSEEFISVKKLVLMK